MVDPFFDLGKNLKQINNTELQEYLTNENNIFERAFVPSSRLEPIESETVVKFKDKNFKSMRFFQTTFFRVIFTKCRFDDCLFLSASFEECEFHDCTFIKCNTNKFNLTKTYLDPRSFLDNMFDRDKYSNIGIDLFHTLLKNSVNESQPEFRDTAEYHFRLWQRYNRTNNWCKLLGLKRWANHKFYMFWFWNFMFQKIFGYGVRARNILLWTPLLFSSVWLYNFWCWNDFCVDPTKLPNVSKVTKTAFFTVGNLSTFGTGDLTATTQHGLIATSFQVVLGIAWIALSTGMIVKRFVR